MILFVVGGVDAGQTIELVRRNQAGKQFKPQDEIRRRFDEEPVSVKIPRKFAVLPVSQPKCLFGFKEKEIPAEGELMLRREVESKLMLDALLGPSSQLYQALYDDNLISDSFGSEYNSSPEYAFSIIGGETRDPEELLGRIRASIEETLKLGIEEASFERTRRKKIGGYLRMLNSPEAVAGEFTRYHFRGGDLFKLLDVYESISLDDVNNRMRKHFDWDQMAISIVSREQQ
jgi:predicted Zn-dependent peptidase